MDAPPSGKLRRSAIGTLALAHAGVAKIGHQARKLTQAAEHEEAAQRQHEADLGRILFRALNQLKGTALKVSQVLSAHADFLPAGLRNELAKGCHEVTPLNRASVLKVFRSEFGQAPGDMFAHFEPQAFAAASLGQVHRATLADGSILAVKVQYPGIAASIKSDLTMLRTMVQALGSSVVHLPRKGVVDKVMDEVASKLAEELDYEEEATQLEWFHARVPAADYAVPLPLRSHSSQRVLTMAHLEGLHLDAWLATKPDQTARNHYGQLLFNWFCLSLYQLGRVNADPHAGNFLFLPDGRLGLIDFGCTRQLAPDFLPALQGVWQAVAKRAPRGPYVALRAAYIELNLISPELSQVDFDQHVVPVVVPMVEWQIAPLNVRELDFGTWPAMPMTDAASAKTLAQCMTGMHPDLPYFDRAYLGIMQLLKKIGAVVATENLWMKNY